jgi:hypothetical protein
LIDSPYGHTHTHTHTHTRCTRAVIMEELPERVALEINSDEQEAGDPEWWLKESAIKIQTPACIYMSGSSQSGKSFLVRRLLRERNGVFSEIQNRVVYCYNVLETELVKMAAADSDIILHEGLPDRAAIDEWAVDGSWCLVLDDLMSAACESKDITYLFTVGSHHKKATVIINSHNLFTQGKQSRTISLNSHYFIIFRNRRDANQIHSFARQLYPRNPKFMISAYEHVMTTDHGYLVADLHPASTADEKYRLRTNIFPGEDLVVFVENAAT